MSQAADVQVGQVEVKGARLHYEQRGAGLPVMFVPGGGVDSAHFAAVAQVLADEFRTVTSDRRGNARSPRPAGWTSTTVGEQADDLAGLIDTLGLAPAVVWGSSLGGVVLLDVLVRRPELLRLGVVHEPPLFTVLPDGDRMAARLEALAGAATGPDNTRTTMCEHGHEVLGDVFDRLPPELRERIYTNAAVFFGVEVPGLIGYLHEINTLTRRLGEVTVPVRVMASAEGRDQAVHRVSHSWLTASACVWTRFPDGTCPIYHRAGADRGDHPVHDPPGTLPPRVRRPSRRPSASQTRKRTTSAMTDIDMTAQQYTSESRVLVTGLDRRQVSPADDSGVSLVSTRMEEQFTGGLVGHGIAEHLRVTGPDGSDTFTGVERFTGGLGGRSGSFVLTANGQTAGGVVRGVWHVVPGSGTGELAGLRGHGVFTAVLTPNVDGHFAEATDSFTYWFDT